MSVDDDVIDRVLDGEASAEEAAEFGEWLQAPVNLERFALRAELHSDLRRLLCRRHIQKSALEATAIGPDTRAASSRDQLLSPVSRSRRMLRLAVAGFATVACLLAVLVWPDGESDPASTFLSAATVVSDVNGVLTKEDQPWDDSGIPVGVYELTEGLLNLEFGGGVMVYVEAPARFEAVNDKRVVLHKGRLSARVPPEGVGFTVETPEAEVVDFGTEFSVDVENGTSEVHVFDGLVRVHPGKLNQRDDSRAVDVHASQALRITDEATEPADISIATDRFIRDFDEPRLKYARKIKRLSPLAYYRMPIRDRGLISEPPDYSGVVLTGDGRRPPHARGVLVGGSLRVGADSTGRGGRVDSPPALNTGRFSLAVFVYLEMASQSATVATNLDADRGNFCLSLDMDGLLQASIRSGDAGLLSSTGGSALPPKTWRHVVVTADGEHLRFYEDGNLVSSAACAAITAIDFETLWLGTDARGTHLWDGRIDEMALFDRALTQEEIASLYRTAQEEIARTR